MKLMLLCLSLFILMLTACSGGGDGGATAPAFPGVVAGPQKPATDVFDQDISTATCDSFFVFVDDWSDELRSQIQFGSAACVKKVIELGKIDVNTPLSSEFGNSKIYPLVFALEDDSLFFAKNNKGAFSVIKVLLEAGANPNITDVVDSNILHLALSRQQILSKYPSVVSYLIYSGKVPLEALNKAGLSPYHMAINLGSVENLLLFFDKNIDINKRTTDGRKPLELAFNALQQTTADLLISKNVDVNINTLSGQNALLEAIRLNFESTALKLLPKSDININHQNNSQQTALYLSIQQKMVSVADALLDRNSDVDLRTATSTPLHLALQMQLFEIANRIIGKVKNTSAKNNNGQSIAHMVAIYGQKSQMEELIKRSFPLELTDNQGTTALFSAAVNDNIGMATTLLSAGVSPDTKTKGSPSPLHFSKSLAMVTLLVKSGADVNVLDANSLSPLHIFTTQNNVPVVDYLLKNKADFSKVYQGGENLLMISLTQDNLNLARLYLEAGLSPHEMNSKNETAIFFVQSSEAVQLLSSIGVDFEALNKEQTTVLAKKVNFYLNQPSPNGEKLVLSLIKAGADVNYTYPQNNSTLLHRVVGFLARGVIENYNSLEFKEVMKALLTAGANVNALDSDKKTPLFFADTVAEVEILKQYGANPQLKDSKGDTAVDGFETKRILWTSHLMLLEEDKEAAKQKYDLEYAADPQSKATLIYARRLAEITEAWEGLKLKLENIEKMITLL